MWTATVEVEAPAHFGFDPARRAAGALRYLLVLAVWAALAVVRPGLAWEIFRERREDSPLRRRSRSL